MPVPRNALALRRENGLDQKKRPDPMRVIVIGAGIIGVCTAYWLNRHGMQVTVVDRRSGVAQESSFGNAGILAADYAAPWAAPGMPGRVLAHLFKSEAPVALRASLDPALWKWLVKWLGQCRAERYAANKRVMQRVARYSRVQLAALREEYGFEYERRIGYLQLLRTPRDVEAAQATLQVLRESGIAHQLLGAEEAVAMDVHLQDAVHVGTPLAGAIHYPDDESGNCPLFARLLAAECERGGVEFLFNTVAQPVQDAGDIVAGVRLQDGRTLPAQAVVVASGSDAGDWLARLGVRVPIYPVRGYAANLPLRNDVIGPRRAFVDETYRVTVTPLGQRLRIAGTAELGARGPALRDKALRTLVRTAQDWMPGMLDFSRATWWAGTRPMTPDGPPILGPTRLPGLYLNVGHGSQGWSMAAGTGRIVADLVAGRTPEIDLDGLDIGRYARKN
ncbi:MAG: D-amino acid dehydrogenase [Pigmentiphaga sp.]|uniref:D-amino acid dehydrogenase n=1 Tax=Pigmentiphaga sp. TaxID=1977564 RepID=UPI003B54DFD5